MGVLVISISVENIVVQYDETGAPINPRGPVRDTTDLQDSIRARGLRQPIEVRPHPEGNGKYLLRHGHRRLSAVKALGWSTIPCSVTEPVVAPEDAPVEDVMDMLAGEVHESYPPLSVALAIRRLLTGKKTRKQIAEAWGKPADIVSAYEQMLEAAPSVQEALDNGRMAVSVFARIKHWPEEEQDDLMADAPDGPISMRWVVDRAKARRAAELKAQRELRLEQGLPDPEAPVDIRHSSGLRVLLGQMLSIAQQAARAAALEPLADDPTAVALHQEILSNLTHIGGTNGHIPSRRPEAAPSELLI